MKQSMMFILVAVVALLLLGCAPKPASVADNFLSAMQANNLEKMKELVTAESQQSVEFIAALQAESRIFTSYKITGSEVKDDVAKVKFTIELSEDFQNDEETNKEETLTLVKVDGKWKVHLDKNGMEK